MVRADRAHGLVIENCTFKGRLALADLHDAAIRWTNLEDGGLELDDVHGAQVVGGRITGTAGHRSSVALRDCDGVRIEAVAITDADVAVEVCRSRAIVVGACALLARHTGVKVDGSTDVEVTGNRMRAMRAVHIRASHEVEMRSNGIERAGTVALVEGNRSDVEFDGNRVATARQELLVVDGPQT